LKPKHGGERKNAGILLYAKCGGTIGPGFEGKNFNEKTTPVTSKTVRRAGLKCWASLGG